MAACMPHKSLSKPDLAITSPAALFGDGATMPGLVSALKPPSTQVCEPTS